MADIEVEEWKKYGEDPLFKASVDQLFQHVEAPIDEFVKKHQLLIEKWYHDLPVWLIDCAQDDDLTRLIQIGAAFGERNEIPALTFIAHAYRDIPGLGSWVGSKGKVVGFVDEFVLIDNPHLLGDILFRSYAIASSIMP